jgi:hypothetical protein
MAEALRGLERFVEAEDLASLAYRTAKDVLGKRDHFTLRANGLITAILLRQRKYSQAHERARKLLLLQTEVLGNDHPDTWDTRLTLAMSSAYFRTRAENLEDYYFRLRKSLGEEHGLTITAMRLWFEECLSLNEVVSHVARYPTDFDKQKSLQRDMQPWLRHQTYVNALALPPRLTLLEDACRILAARLGDRDPEVLSTRTLYGRSLLALRCDDQARDVLRGAASDATDTFGVDHPDTLRSCRYLAALYLRQQCAQEAIDLLRKMQPAFEKLRGTGSAMGAFADLLLGQAYVVQWEKSGEFREEARDGAAATLNRALDFFRKNEGEASCWTETARIWAKKCGP